MNQGSAALGPCQTQSESQSGKTDWPARRLAFLVSSLGPGGTERAVAGLASHCASQGRQVHLLTLADATEKPFYDLHPAIEHEALGLLRASTGVGQGIWNTYRRCRVLRAAIRASQPNLLVSFGDRTNVLALLACCGVPVPVMVAERSNPASQPIGGVWNVLRRLLYPRAKCVVVQTERARQYFSSRVRQRIVVIPNAVQTVGPSAVHKAHGRGASDGSRLMLAMGRFSEEKQFDLVLQVFARLASRHPNWQLSICGDGPLRSKLEAQRDGLGLAGRVRFPGVVKPAWTAMGEADLFVFSSRYEGFPNVLCEAMACGLPVVSFDCPNGPREIIRDGIDGVLVSPGDLEAMTAAVDRLMSSDQERDHLAGNAPSVLERFSAERVLGQWDKLFDRIGKAAIRDGSRRHASRQVCM